MLYALAAAATLYVLWSPRLGGAVFNFLFADVVPGSNRMLEPNDVILAVIAILSIGLVILLLVWLFRHVAARRALRSLADPDTVIYDSSWDRPAKAAQSAELIKAVVAEAVLPIADVERDQRSTHLAPTGRWLPRRLLGLVRRHRQSTQAVEYDFQNKIRAVLSAIIAWFATVLRRVVKAISHLVQIWIYAIRRAVGSYMRVTHGASVTIGRFVFATVKLVLRWLLVATVIISIVAATAAMVGLSYAQKFWDWLRPYLVRLDSWLEVQCRALLAWSRRKLGRSEMAQVAGTMLRTSKDSLRQLFK